jgi:transposase
LREKLALVERHREEHGLNRCLKLVGVSKSTWHRRMRRRGESKQQARDRRLKGPVIQIVKEHPAYGYRRMVAELLDAFSLRVNPKRLRRVLKQWDLALPRQVSRPRRSGVHRILRQGKGQLNLLSGWRPGSLEALSTDFSEVRYAGGRKKAHLMALSDIGSHWVSGWALGPSPNRELALTAWGRSRRQLLAIGRGPEG